MSLGDGSVHFVSEAIDYEVWLFLRSAQRWPSGAVGIDLMRQREPIRSRSLRSSPAALPLPPAVACLLAWLACLSIAGCGEGLPETVPVRGRVSWRNEPLTEGTVVFHPHAIDEGRPGAPATGKLQADGSFVLTTFRNADGAVPGAYRVTVHSYESDLPRSTTTRTQAISVLRIPQHYGDPSRQRPHRRRARARQRTATVRIELANDPSHQSCQE